MVHSTFNRWHYIVFNIYWTLLLVQIDVGAGNFSSWVEGGGGGDLNAFSSTAVLHTSNYSMVLYIPIIISTLFKK